MPFRKTSRYTEKVKKASLKAKAKRERRQITHQRHLIWRSCVAIVTNEVTRKLSAGANKIKRANQKGKARIRPKAKERAQRAFMS